MPDQPYVTFPGTTGNYISTPDTNLLDADTAHLAQSDGGYRQASTTGGTLDSLAAPPPGIGLPPVSIATNVLKFTKTAAVGDEFTIRSSERQAAVSGATSDVYAGCWVYIDADAVAVAASDMRFGPEFFNGGAYLGGHYSVNEPNYKFREWFYLESAPYAPDYPTVTGATLYWRVGDNLPVGAEVYVGPAVLRRDESTFVPSLRIVGDLDTRMTADVDELFSGPANSEALSTFTAAGLGYRMRPRTNDTVICSAWVDGAERTVTAPKPAGTGVGVLQFTYDVSTGDAAAYWNGVELLTTPRTVGAIEVSDQGLTVAADRNGASPWAGDLFGAEVRDGIDGPIVAQFDAADVGGAL